MHPKRCREVDIRSLRRFRWLTAKRNLIIRVRGMSISAVDDMDIIQSDILIMDFKFLFFNDRNFDTFRVLHANWNKTRKPSEFIIDF